MQSGDESYDFLFKKVFSLSNDLFSGIFYDFFIFWKILFELADLDVLDNIGDLLDGVGLGWSLFFYVSSSIYLF